ncbi:MAG: response regulator [Caldilinea sp.]|nr:response regulator [Caldilinea sp.]
MNLERVLLIEDNNAVRRDIAEEFATAGVEVIALRDYDDLQNQMSNLPLFQMVILDWLLDGETEFDALLCLDALRQSRFVPVIIWTEELERFKAAEVEVKSRFPEACFRGYSKSQVNHQRLLEVLSDWHQQVPARLAERFRQSVANAVEQTLYALAEQSLDDLAKGLKTLIVLGDASEVDMEHATDVMLRLLGRQLYADSFFVDELRGIVKGLTTSNPQPSKKERQRISQIAALYMFYRPSDDVVRNGDIVTVSLGEEKDMAVVLTPACDLANPGKTPYLRLAMLNLQPNRGGGKTPDDRWSLPFQGKSYEVCFHEILVLRNTTTANVARESASVMRYTHAFTTLHGVDVAMQRECRLDEPYRADLLHNFVSHAGRVGLPDFSG